MTPPHCHRLLHEVARGVRYTVADALVTRCRCCVRRELLRNYGWNFKSRLMEVVLEYLGESKTRTISLQLS